MDIRLPDKLYDIIIYMNLVILIVLIPAIVVKPEMKLQNFMIPAFLGLFFGGVIHVAKDIVEKGYTFDRYNHHLTQHECEEELMRNDYSASVISLLFFVINIIVYLATWYYTYKV